jgi:hypothetical protein
MWAQRSPEEHSRILSRRSAGLEPDRFGFHERVLSTAAQPADLSDEETFDRVDQPLRFSARVEQQEAESVEYRCARVNASRPRAVARTLVASAVPNG